MRALALVCTSLLTVVSCGNTTTDSSTYNARGSEPAVACRTASSRYEIYMNPETGAVDFYRDATLTSQRSLYRATKINDGIAQRIQYRFQLKPGSLIVTVTPGVSPDELSPVDVIELQIDGKPAFRCLDGQVNDYILSRAVSR